jgi:type I restriction enzyme S subunit
MSDWPVKTLGDLMTVQNGYAFDSQSFSPSGKIGLIRIRDLKGGVETETRFFGSYDDEYVVTAGDYLIGMDGEFRCYEWKGDPALLNQRVCRLRDFGRSLDARFLFYGINKFLKEIEDVTGYTTVKHLSSKSILSIKMPVPPLEEQRRIVALLDAATARVNELTACYEQARTHANNLFSSALRDALENNHDLPIKTLGSIFRVCSSKRVLKSEWKQSGVPFYRGREITALSKHGFVENELFISEEHFSDLVQKYGVPKIGDIMITAIGTIGNSYVVKEADRFYFKDASVIWLDKQTEIISSYVQYWIRSSRFRDQLNAGNGATVDTLTIDGLSKMQIPVPSLEEQKRIVARLDSMQAKTSEMVTAYDAKLTAAKNLRQSILESAFAGDL